MDPHAGDPHSDVDPSSRAAGAQLGASEVSSPPQTGGSIASQSDEARQPTGETAGDLRKSRRVPVARVVGALLVVAIVECALALCMIDAFKAQVPRNMPFAVTAASPVVTAAESAKLSGFQVSFVNTVYANEADAIRAIDEAKVYGAYVVGTTGDTLLTAAAKSFGASTSIKQLFGGAAVKLGRPLAVREVKPLPTGKDPYGDVSELLLLPAIVGGLLAAILIFQSTGRAAEEWRVGILVGYALLAALLTDLIVGPAIGAYSGSHFWSMLLCLWLLTATVALVTAALLSLFKGIVAMVLALFVFIILGLPSAGAGGVALLPSYWQAIGAALPPRYGATLFTNVLYFSSNNIATSIWVLLAYALLAAAVLAYLGWVAPRRRALAGAHGDGSTTRRKGLSISVPIVVGVFLVAILEQGLFASNYMSSSHNPVAHELPFAVTGNSPLTGAVQEKMSLDIKTYPDEAAAKKAIDEAKVFGALIPGEAASTLLVVPTASGLAPYNLAVHFGEAAKAQGQKLTVSSYTPTALPAGATSAIVISLLLVPLLVGGYMSATLLRAVTGEATQRFRGMVLLGYAVVAALLVDLIAGPWLDSYPTDKFWIVWPILALVTLNVALFAVVMHRLFGAVGTLVTVIVIILFGKPAAGGASGVPYLPGFWTTIGPFLPPRNALILLRNTIYFDGNGISQALIVLLAYLAVFAVLVGVLDWYRLREPKIPISPETETEAASASIPAGAAG